MYRFEVPGMKCGGCAKKVKRAVRSKDASAGFSADVENRRVTVAFSVPPGGPRRGHRGGWLRQPGGRLRPLADAA